MRTKKGFYLILFTTELSLVIIAFIITVIKKEAFFSVFNFPASLYTQIPAGLFAGIPAALIITFLALKLPFFSEILKLFSGLIKNYRIRIHDIFLIAALAGVCEEVLFRGIMQPSWGIWITSFIFILLHGYFNPLSLRMSVFGIIMFFLSVLIGLIYEAFGLAAAISFHFFYDFTSLLAAYFHFNKKDTDEQKQA